MRPLDGIRMNDRYSMREEEIRMRFADIECERLRLNDELEAIVKVKETADDVPIEPLLFTLDRAVHHVSDESYSLIRIRFLN